jgi:hypothetical protein
VVRVLDQIGIRIFSIPLINNRLTIDIESYFTAITALVN